MLLAWLLYESETTRSVAMSARGGTVWHRAKQQEQTIEIPFLRAAVELTNEPAAPFKIRWWANVLREGASYREHKHDGKWAFAYHLTEGAALHFGNDESFLATPGQLLVFKANLQHWTDKVEGPEPRVSIAGNLYFRN
jgi:hypothetical protein